MRLSKQEIEEQLVHKRAIVRALITRQRPLELQAAQKGINTPAEVMTEISALTEQIRAQEEEMTRLETIAAESHLSLIEAEYRVMLAKAWDTARGRPTLASLAELELARLRMGLLPEKAEQIEYEVRTALVEETFSNLDIEFLDVLPKIQEPEAVITFGAGNQFGDVSIGDIVAGNIIRITTNTGEFDSPYTISLRVTGKAIRLDKQNALRLFLIILPGGFRLDIETFGRQLIAANRVWNYQEDRDVFEWFLVNLTQSLTQRTKVAE